MLKLQFPPSLPTLNCGNENSIVVSWVRSSCQCCWLPFRSFTELPTLAAYVKDDRAAVISGATRFPGRKRAVPRRSHTRMHSTISLQ
ncbi:hypothetical protein C2E23DRAFT_532949 [Lenzites betulinus]|nr:hypothetical protein C2E23DRAFT_532949 [Lenzites betulinus]